MASSDSSDKVDVAQIVGSLRTAFQSEKTLDLSWRKHQLAAMANLLKENEDALMKALHDDLGKCKTEAYLSEIGGCISEIKHFISHLHSYATAERVATPLAQVKGLSVCEIQPEPLGVVLIIGAWNYPVQLVLSPMIPAIAAGNCVLLKPSEVAEHTSHLLAELIPKYLDKDCFRVIEGGVDVTTEILKHRFDHILYTGNSTVGKIIMRAAAEFLTPVTLELGGKSPCIVDKTCSMDVTARRVVWGKFYNAGQTCIAVDHVFVHESIEKEFLDAVVKVTKDFYGENPKESADFGRIISTRHLQRIAGLLSDIPKEQIVIGGDVEESTRYIAPTIIKNVSPDAKIMQDEIFGPILPVLTYKSLDDLLAGFKTKEKPLAFYVFSNDHSTQRRLQLHTSSGQFVVNETLMQHSVPSLPFGGVGNSGMGAYHGKVGFDTFSHLKSVLNKTTWLDLSVRYPPYSDANLASLKKFQ